MKKLKIHENHYWPSEFDIEAWPTSKLKITGSAQGSYANKFFLENMTNNRPKPKQFTNFWGTLLKVPSGQIGSKWEWYHWKALEKDINSYKFLIFYFRSWIF